MLRKLWKRLSATPLCGASVLTLAGLAQAQEPSTPAISLSPPVAAVPVVAPAAVSAATEDLKSRIDRLEKQNQDLLEALQKLQSNLQNLPQGVGGSSSNLA